MLSLDQAPRAGSELGTGDVKRTARKQSPLEIASEFPSHTRQAVLDYITAAILRKNCGLGTMLFAELAASAGARLRRPLTTRRQLAPLKRAAAAAAAARVACPNLKYTGVEK